MASSTTHGIVWPGYVSQAGPWAASSRAKCLEMYRSGGYGDWPRPAIFFCHSPAGREGGSAVRRSFPSGCQEAIRRPRPGLGLPARGPGQSRSPCPSPPQPRSPAAGAVRPSAECQRRLLVTMTEGPGQTYRPGPCQNELLSPGTGSVSSEVIQRKKAPMRLPERVDYHSRPSVVCSLPSVV